MYSLVLFYLAAKDDLAPIKPMPKFLCIKAVIFFSFWQGVAIAIIKYFGGFEENGLWTVDDITNGLQNFLICIEMFLISIVHIFVFGYEAFRNPNKEPFLRSLLKGKFAETTSPMLSSFRDALHPK